MENFKANRESLNGQHQNMTLKPVPTSGRFKVTSSVVTTMNLEFNYVPKEETFPIPLKYIDVTRSAHTDLDVMQEQRMDDCWIIDSNRSLSVSWKGFTKFTLLLKEKTAQGIYVVREETDKCRILIIVTSGTIRRFRTVQWIRRTFERDATRGLY